MPTRLILNEDGSLVRETICSADVTGSMRELLLRSVLNELFVVTPNLGENEFASEYRLGLSGSPGKKACVAGFRLKKLNFHAAWSLDADGNPRPTFLDGDAVVDPESLGSLGCPIPEFVQLWLLFSMPWAHQLSAQISPYLFARVRRDESSHRWCVPPLPNLHSNGELCFGDYPDTYQCGNPTDAAEALLETWMASKWNKDLFDGVKPAKFNDLFAWSPEGKLAEQTPDAWLRNSVATSPGGPVTRFMEELDKILEEENDDGKI